MKRTPIFVNKQEANKLYNYNHVIVSMPITSGVDTQTFKEAFAKHDLKSLTPFGEALLSEEKKAALLIFNAKNSTRREHNRLYNQINNIIEKSEIFKTKKISESISHLTIKTIESYLINFFNNVPTVERDDESPLSVMLNTIYDYKVDVESEEITIIAYTTEDASDNDKETLKNTISTLKKELEKRSDIEKVKQESADNVYKLIVKIAGKDYITTESLRKMTFDKINMFLSEDVNDDDEENDIDDEENDIDDINDDLDDETLILGDIDNDNNDNIIIDNTDTEKDNFSWTEGIDTEISGIVSSDKEITISPAIIEDFGSYAAIITVPDEELDIDEENDLVTDAYQKAFSTMKKRVFMSDDEDSPEELSDDLYNDGGVILRAPSSILSEMDMFDWCQKIEKLFKIIGFTTILEMDENTTFDDFEVV